MKENKGITLISMILITIFTLIIGVILGYAIKIIIQDNMKNVESGSTEMAQHISDKVIENKVPEQPTKTTSQEPQVINDNIKYDGSKDVTINGTKYTIAYNTLKERESNGTDTYEATIVRLYLNNKKVKSIDLGFIEDINHMYGANGYAVDLYSFCKDYILIHVKTHINRDAGAEFNKERFCIINTKGEHIDTIDWSDATSIYEKSTHKKMTYEINNDSLIVYASYDIEHVQKEQYTVNNDVLIKNSLKTYNLGEFEFAGK